jgi:hypothetical protein
MRLFHHHVMIFLIPLTQSSTTPEPMYHAKELENLKAFSLCSISKTQYLAGRTALLFKKKQKEPTSEPRIDLHPQYIS